MTGIFRPYPYPQLPRPSAASLPVGGPGSVFPTSLVKFIAREDVRIGQIFNDGLAVFSPPAATVPLASTSIGAAYRRDENRFQIVGEFIAAIVADDPSQYTYASGSILIGNPYTGDRELRARTMPPGALAPISAPTVFVFPPSFELVSFDARTPRHPWTQQEWAAPFVPPDPPYFVPPDWPMNAAYAKRESVPVLWQIFAIQQPIAFVPPPITVSITRRDESRMPWVHDEWVTLFAPPDPPYFVPPDWPFMAARPREAFVALSPSFIAPQAPPDYISPTVVLGANRRDESRMPWVQGEWFATFAPAANVQPSIWPLLTIRREEFRQAVSPANSIAAFVPGITPVPPPFKLRQYWRDPDEFPQILARNPSALFYSTPIIDAPPILRMIEVSFDSRLLSVDPPSRTLDS
jgi:hypothetical protein